MKSKMSKKEIQEIKSKAKKRTNRRLPDGEYHRLLARVDRGEEQRESLPIVDIDSSKLLMGDGYVNSQEVQCMRRHISKAFQEVARENLPLNKNRKNRRLTNKQFKELMRMASIELGINDKKGFGILDLDKSEPIPLKKQFERILLALSFSQSFVYNRYMELTKGKRPKLKDKLAILGWLMYPTIVTKPFCLIPEKDRSKKVRQIGLRPWGDVKIRPIRVVPGEEYIREVTGKKRHKTDAYDRLPLDKKIEWARHAKRIIGDGESLDLIKTTVQTLFYKEDMNILLVAMRYGCKMTGISYFRSVYAEPYWIGYRINKYCNNMTSKEYSVFLQMAQDFLGTSNKKTEPILSLDELHKKLKEILRSFGLEKKYNQWIEENKDRVGLNYLSVKKVSDFIQEYYQTH